MWVPLFVAVNPRKPPYSIFLTDPEWWKRFVWCVGHMRSKWGDALWATGGSLPISATCASSLLFLLLYNVASFCCTAPDRLNCFCMLLKYCKSYKYFCLTQKYFFCDPCSAKISPSVQCSAPLSRHISSDYSAAGDTRCYPHNGIRPSAAAQALCCAVWPSQYFPTEAGLILLDHFCMTTISSFESITKYR